MAKTKGIFPTQRSQFPDQVHVIPSVRYQETEVEGNGQLRGSASRTAWRLWELYVSAYCVLTGCSKADSYQDSLFLCVIAHRHHQPMSVDVPNGVSKQEAMGGLKEGLAEPECTIKVCVEDHGLLYYSCEASVIGKGCVGLPTLSWAPSQGSQGTGCWPQSP